MSYNRLWKLLIYKDMKKQDSGVSAKLSSSSIAKLSKGENVDTGILVKMHKALGCDVSDIMGILPDKED